MSLVLSDRKDLTVSEGEMTLADFVVQAHNFYGDLEWTIKEATTAQQLVDSLRVARRKLGVLQRCSAKGTPAYERYTNRISYISGYINQVKNAFAEEVQ